MKASKKRIDLLLVEQGLASSREKAQAYILSGNVLVDDQPVTKPGQEINLDSKIRFKEEISPYVSRGALKLKRAIEEFKISCSERVALDVGASTGGFTEILLLEGAKKVFAIDVGQNQLDWKIRKDPKVIVKEKLNARIMGFEEIGEKVDIITVDVSFISLEKVVPNLIQFSHANTDWITLIKPQFEVGPDQVGKGGIVREEASRLKVVERIKESFSRLGICSMGVIESPILGTKGNHEFLGHWRQK